MAVTTLRDQIARLVSTELNPARRYRCLVLQTDQIDLLDRLCECLPSALVMAGKPPGVARLGGVLRFGGRHRGRHRQGEHPSRR